ncbi:ribbon-helix-helix protein, CopG family [Faecalispora jeddahensis]
MRVETKMTTAELERLDYCCKVSGKSRSEIIREGIDVVYTKLSNPEQK